MVEKTVEVNDPIIEQAIQRIADNLHPKQIILFGSRAKGETHFGSDIDLLLIYDGPLAKKEVHMRVLNLFDYWDIALDVFVLNSDEWKNLKAVANTLAREAAETGIVCYG